MCLCEFVRFRKYIWGESTRFGGPNQIIWLTQELKFPWLLFMFMNKSKVRSVCLLCVRGQCADGVVLCAGVSATPGGGRLADSAGAFSYEESGKLLSLTSNRFIHWWVMWEMKHKINQHPLTNQKQNSTILCCSALCCVRSGPHQETQFSWWNSLWT